MDKNNGTIVIHLPADKERQFKRLAERQGLCPSEYGRLLVDNEINKHRDFFEFMKSVFGSDG